jgi:hypothetical protein
MTRLSLAALAALWAARKIMGKNCKVEILDFKVKRGEHSGRASILAIFILGSYGQQRDIFGTLRFHFFRDRIANGYDRECHIGKSTEVDLDMLRWRTFSRALFGFSVQMPERHCDRVISFCRPGTP